MALPMAQTTCSTLKTGDPLYDEYPGFWVFIGASIIGFWYWATDQHIVQRVLGQRKGESSDEVMKRARRGTIAAGYFKLLPVFMFLIPGMIAAALAARPGSGFTLENPDTAFGSMVKFVLPAGVKGIVTIGFISALVASLAAFFNSCATLYTEDFYKPMFKGKTEARYVLVGRIATIVCSNTWYYMDTCHDESRQSLFVFAGHSIAACSCYGSRIRIGYIFQENYP